MPVPYYIDSTNNIWIKDDIAPLGTNVYYIKKTAGYIPNGDKIFQYVDNFNDNSINTSKWFTDGTGTIEEVSGYAHVVGTVDNKYPRFVTATPVPLGDCILEYDMKVTGVVADACRIGYTSYYIDGSNAANWYLYVDSTRYINFWTRINGVWALRWKSIIQVSLNTWYKIRFIGTSSKLKVQILSVNEILITESALFSYDNTSENSIYFGQRSIGDSGYFDNFIVRQYAEIEPSVSVFTESDGYKIVITNNLGTELHNYQIKIPTTNIGSFTSTSSVCIEVLYKTPLKEPYYRIYDNCIMYIPYMNTDVTNNHTLTVYNNSFTLDRFSGINRSIQFNGTNTRGIIYHKNDLDLFNSNNFTLIMWIKQIGDYSTRLCSLLSKSTNAASSTNRWRLQINKNNIGFIIQDCSIIIDCTNLSNPIKINDNNWHMVTFIRNGAYLYTYKDGILMQTISLNGMCNFSNTGNVDVGCMLTLINYDKFFNGMFGEIILNNTSFSSKNILNYYNLTKFRYVPLIVNTYQY